MKIFRKEYLITIGIIILTAIFPIVVFVGQIVLIIIILQYFGVV